MGFSKQSKRKVEKDVEKEEVARKIEEHWLICRAERERDAEGRDVGFWLHSIHENTTPASIFFN